MPIALCYDIHDTSIHISRFFNDMKVEIYTSPGCVWCDKAVKLLEMAKITDYDKYVVGENIQAEEVRVKYPMSSGYPIIIIDGENVGGVVGAAKKFIELGLVSSKK